MSYNAKSTYLVPSVTLRSWRLMASVVSVQVACRWSKCPTKLVVKVKIEDEDSEWHVVTMFNSTLEKVIDVSGSPSVVKRLLLDLPRMVFEVNVKDVVSEAVCHNGTWREDPADTSPLQ